MAITKSYQFNNPLSMTDLAIEIQSNVYWGGHAYLLQDNRVYQISWKEFWSIVCDEIDQKQAKGVTIGEDNTIRFTYEGDE